MEKQTLPKHSKIFEYWKDKCITRSGKIVLAADADLKDMEVVRDWGEPQCWACGKPIGDDSWVKENGQAYETEEELIKIWNHKSVTRKFQKAHIIPEALGGAATPDNLFLLCGRCHEDSPDTTNREAFFRWVYDKKRNCVMGVDLVNAMSGLNNELERRGWQADKFYEFSSLLWKDDKMDNIGQFLEEYYKNNCNTHGAIMVESTRHVAHADVLERMVENRINQLHDGYIDKTNLEMQKGVFTAIFEGYSIHVYRNSEVGNWKYSVPMLGVHEVDTGTDYNDLAREIAVRKTKERLNIK